jgi:clan AA aspartic protease (TIGR02281 family)
MRNDVTPLNRLGLIAGLALFILAALRAAAQEDVYTWTDENGVVNFSNSAPPEGVEAKAVHSENTFQSVPLVVENNRKRVRVELQGTQQSATVQMIVDTGAQQTMIDADLARAIGVYYMRNELIGGVTGVGVGALVEVPRLRIGSAELRNVNVLVGPTSNLSLLGMDILSRLNLSVGQNTLFRSSR